MAQVFLAEYGRAFTFNFPLLEVDGVDFRVDAVHASGDAKIMKDEGAEANTGSGFVDEGQSYSQALTATEMQAKRVTYLCVDQTATKVWLDSHITIETFGHQSSAHPNLSPYWTNGAVNDGSASSTVWTFDGFTEATADHVIGSELTFTSGANAGQTRTVTDYTSTVITVSPAFLAAPADNDEFVLKAVAQTTLGIGQAPSIGDILADVTGIAGAAMRGTDSAALASEVTSARMSELDDSAGKLVAVADLIKAAADAIKLETDKLTLGDAGAGTAGSIIEEIENRPTTAMRGTDNAATEAKQDIIDTNVDQIETAVITNATGTDIAADIIAVKAETALIVADTNELQTDDVPGSLTTLQSDTDDIQARLPAALSTAGNMKSDMLEVDSDVDAAKQLRDNMDTTERFVVHNAFTPTTTQVQPDAVFFGDTAGTLEATDDHYNGKTLIGLTGALKGQPTDITDYDGTNKRFTFTAMTEAFANNDQFIIV